VIGALAVPERLMLTVLLVDPSGLPIGDSG
jgi:hypothetical protein